MLGSAQPDDAWATLVKRCHRWVCNLPVEQLDSIYDEITGAFQKGKQGRLKVETPRSRASKPTLDLTPA